MPQLSPPCPAPGGLQHRRSQLPRHKVTLRHTPPARDPPHRAPREPDPRQGIPSVIISTEKKHHRPTTPFALSSLYLQRLHHLPSRGEGAEASHRSRVSLPWAAPAAPPARVGRTCTPRGVGGSGKLCLAALGAARLRWHHRPGKGTSCAAPALAQGRKPTYLSQPLQIGFGGSKGT